MKASIIAISTASILSMVLLTSPASSQQQTTTSSQQKTPSSSQQQSPDSQQQTCGEMSGQSIRVLGTIDYITMAPPRIIYHLRSEGRPCISDAFTIVDPSGFALCREGLKITAFGPLQITMSGAQITTTNYSCQ
jgi:hypothetical protein